MAEIVDVNTMFGPLPAAASDLSVDELEAMMHKHGVGIGCTLSTVGVLLDHTAGNAATRAACREHHRLVPVATLNPQSVFGNDAAFTRFAADGFKMVRLFPATQGWEADYAPCVATARQLEAEGLPIMVDVDRSGVATRLANALAGHGGALVLGGIDETMLAESIALMRNHPRLYVETSNLLAVGAIKQVVDSVGSERLLYGSGAPARPMAAALGVLRQAGLSDTDRDRILVSNARQLLNL